MKFEEWGVFLKQNNAGEMQTLVTLQEALSPRIDEWVDNPSPMVKKPVRRALWSICNALQYKNMLWMRGDDLSDAMRVSVQSLPKVLGACEGYLSVGTRLGGIGPYGFAVNAGYRVLINPMLAYRWHAPEDCGKKDLRYRFWFDRMVSFKNWSDMVLDKQERI